MSSRSSFYLCALVLMSTTLLCASCSKPATADVDPREFILRSWGEHLILPQYADFEDTSRELAAESATLCEAPDATQLERTQQAWRTARVSWKRLEVFGFGPHVAFPERYGAVLDFWPARVDTIEETLGEPTRIAALDMAGAASRGLPVVEYLLFSQGNATLDSLTQTPERCAYLVAATRDVSAQAAGIAGAWRPDGGDYVDTMLNPDDHPEGMFMDRHEALSEVVNRMAFLIDNIRRDKLGKPVGEMTGEPSPESMESRFGEHAIEDIKANLDMIDWLFVGHMGAEAPEGVYGLKDHPRLSTRDGITTQFRQHMTASRDALEALKLPLAEVIAQDPAKIIALIETLGDLQRVIQVDIINALALTRSFNDSDGD